MDFNTHGMIKGNTKKRLKLRGCTGSMKQVVLGWFVPYVSYEFAIYFRGKYKKKYDVVSSIVHFRVCS